MRILHLATFLQGGAGRAIVDLVREQLQAGHAVTVVASGTGAPGYGNYQTYLDELEGLRVPVRLVDSMFVRAHAPNLAVVRAIDEIVRPGQEPQIIHAHGAIPSLVALLFAGARRTPLGIVQTMHGWGLVKTGDQVATDVAVLNLVDRVAVPSAESARMLASLGVAPARLAIVPYGVRADVPDPDDRDRQLIFDMGRARREGCLVIACVGTVSQRKNQVLIVEALARVAELPALAVFVGDGDDQDLRWAAAAHGVEARVRLHGYSRAARAIAAAADVLVLPSRSEGQPVAVLEAFCDGTLVAVSDIPELVELVEDGMTGLTFAAGDAGSLASALVGIARLPNTTRRALRERARARYASRFTVTAMANSYAALYRAIADGAGERRTDVRRGGPAGPPVPAEPEGSALRTPA